MNKRTEQTRWTPKRLLSLLMALIMTLSLLPTAAFADDEGGDTVYEYSNLLNANVSTEIYKWFNNNEECVHIDIYPNELSEANNGKTAFEEGATVNIPLHVSMYFQPTDSTRTESYSVRVGYDGKDIRSNYLSASYSVNKQAFTFNSTKKEEKLVITTTASSANDQKLGVTCSLLRLGSESTNTQIGSISFEIKLPLVQHYTVTYDANGGTLSAAAVNGTTRTEATEENPYSQVFDIPAEAKSTLSGYTFEGWQVSGDGSFPTGVVSSGTKISGITSDITLKANLVKNQEISFDPVYSGVSGLPYDYKDMSQGQTYTIPYTPELSGYNFKGWTVTGATLDADGVSVKDITSPITITPIWEKSDGTTPVGSHSVKFVRNNTTDGSALNWPDDLTGAAGDTVTIPWNIPRAEGYTFLGWSTSNAENATAENAYKPGTEVMIGDTDTSLYAVWQAKNYTISYTPDNSLTGVTLISTASSITPGTLASFNVKVDAKYDASSMIVAANGVPLGYSVKTENTDGSTTYTYSFVPTGDTAVTVSQPEQKSYVVTLPVGDHFTAKFDGTDTKSDKTVTYNGSVSFTVTADSGWTIEDVSYTGDATLTRDTTDLTKYTLTDIKSNVAVSVKMKQIPVYTISYSIDEAYFTSQKVTGESANVTLITPAERTGYNFDGWYKNPGYTDKAEATLTVTGDVNLYGRYKPITKSISYDMNAPTGATVTPNTIDATIKTYGQAVTLSAQVPTCDGYDFLGWAKGENKGLVVYAAGATVSEELTADMTLYAVWAKKTYTITLQGGSGYTVSSNQALVVEHGSTFTFTVTVDGAYAAIEPVVTANGTTPTKVSGEPNTKHEAATYTYKIENVTADQVVTVKVTENARATVTFQYRVVDAQGNEVTVTGLSGNTFMTQAVQLGDPAAQPQQPNIEGYKFVRWCGADHPTATTHTDYDFTKPVADELTIYAEITPILPVITITELNGTGWKTENWQYGTETMTNADTTNKSFTIAYGDNVTFDLVISKGYDYSKLSVTANGLALGYQSATTDEKTGVTTLHYYLGSVMADTRIAITGIERKTITITYYDNARDDTSNPLAPQIANYYVENATDNSTFTKQAPVRTGYTFLGWSTDGTAKEATYKWDAIDSTNGLIIEFTKDTALYAIWKADALTAELIITDEFTSAPSGTTISGSKLEYAYEGDSITLVGKLSADAQGTMTFYKKAKTATDWTFLGTTSINGGNYGVLGTTVENYKWGNADDTSTKNNYRWDYKVEFKPTTDEGYSLCDASDDLRVYSKAISWEVDKKADKTNFDWIKAQNELTIYTNEARTAATDKMTANSTYWLQIPTVVELDGGRVLKNQSKNLSVGTHYEITWEYEDSANHWTTYTTTSDTDWVKVTPEYSGYSFRAKVTPTQSSIYTKAATYDENGTVVKDVYWDYLITKATAKTEKQATATALTIDAPEESKDIKINGDTHFTAIGEHKAQFEGQAVTLTAKVTKDGGNDGVETGYVKFYRHVDGTNDTLLNTTLISVDANGIATLEVKVSAWDTAKDAAQNLDQFYAVYETNETYETSKSDSEAVYIKSAKLMTPVIESTLAGKLDDTNKTAAQATTYKYNLTELLAGVQHTFTLRTTGAEATTGDWSVVALDGRTVATKNYDIEWQYKTGDNFVKANNESTQAAYTTTTTKVDDRYRVKLTGKGVFAGSEATSQDAVIGTKQDVTVTVKAIDAITKTPETDVYQLNEITLTTTVAAAKGADATMKPAGTVTFYYSVDGNNWTKIGEAKDLAEVAGVMTASIKTDQLPVKANDNTKQDVKITAVYSGDATFNASATVNETEKSITAAAGCTTTNDTVTVYSSVVFNCNDENKKQTTNGDKGIHISVSDGAFKTNEKATLALSDIYTLDRELTDETLRNTIAKLNPTTDYTVQWQKLNGATAIGDAEGTDFANSKRWTDIGATGTTLVLDKVEQNTAYRAVITVNDQPITKGSSTEVDQTIKGRQVYYSNVLMPTDTSMTVSVALNTSKIDAENTEGITEGETVTANVFLSGVVGVVPNANVTVTVTNDSAKGNNTAYEKTFTSMNTVNGWNAFSWNTAESDDKGVPTAPGFYTLTVSATTNTGYAAKEITRSLIVRESSYTIAPSNTTVTYNGRTQGLTVTLDGFDFKGTGINEAANKSWTVRYEDANGNPVEPTQAGTYKAVITLPASAYWTEQTKTVDFIIEKRSVSIADAIAQAKVYDGTTDVNIVEVMLNDAETEQGTTGWLKSGENTGIINGDSIYAVATEAKLSSANAGNNSFKISTIELRGDDANNYVWNEAPYTEDIYVSRSQVYGEHGTLELKQGETFPADKVIKMIDQSGREITLGTGTEDYTLTFYYHSDTKIEKTTDISKLGLYTVVARPNQSNYKSGVTMQFTVVETATNLTEAATPKPSTLITISNTAELYGAATGVTASTTNSTATTTIEYQSGSTGWTTTAPTSAGRYLVRVTANTGDVAYGIYTITKAHPELTITPADTTYNSMPQNGYSALTGNNGTEGVDWHITYAGDVAIGYNTPADGNVDEQAPVDAGTYTVTLHVNETANYTAHEISKSFTIAKKALTIKADSWQTTQYDAFPDMTAKYEGLAAVDTDTTPDTSLRDVQIAPEYLYNPTNGKSNYNNDTLDQVGYVAIQPVDALSKNYAITYVDGQYTKQRDDASPDLAIHGLPQSGDRTVNRVYYGDEIQLYPYGYYTTHANGSGILEWSVTTATGFKGTVTIGKETGLLNVNGVGEFTVTLKRGVGEQQISTSVTVTAIQKEAKIALKNVDKVYTGASQTYAYEGNVTVHDELYQALPYFDATKVTRTNTDRIDVGTQITTAKVTGAWAYQSETYGGKFTINDKEATVAPVAQSTVYGTLETFDTTPTYKVDGKAGSVDPVTGVNVASQTDAYNRLDVHDGYEILVAGAENMNYNVKYTTDETAEDSAVTTYDGMKLYSTTTKAKNELNDATVYGEQANDLDWILDAVKSTNRDGETYADNLADFDLVDTTGIFIKQDKDDCVGNAKTYKAANREEGNTSSTALAADRTATDTAKDDNYELKFGSVTNAKAANYTLANAEVKNAEGTMTAPTGTVGFIGAAATSDNLIEGSANIAQRPIKLEKAVDDVQLYWKLSQKQLYTALVNVLKAEENSVGRGLAKGHTIEDLDLSFTIKVGSTTYNVAKDGTDAINFATTGNATVTATVGDTNYKLEGGQYQFDIVLKNIQIEATYTTKTFTGFTVLIKVHNEGGAITPLNDAKGLSYKIFKKTGDTIDKTTAYASGTLTYQNRTAYDDKGVLCGVFTATYPQLPLLNSGETYFIQMYEYGVELKTNS